MHIPKACFSALGVLGTVPIPLPEHRPVAKFLFGLLNLLHYFDIHDQWPRKGI